MSDNNSDLLKRISNVLLSKGVSPSKRLQAIAEAMVEHDALDEPEPDPFAGLRNRAIEITDLDGLTTYVTVGVILGRIEDGWIPGILALSEDEMRALDHVLRIWEHEARARLLRLVKAADDREQARLVREREGSLLHDDQPWQTLGHMTKAQEAYRLRLRLPKHPHGECCHHYEEEAHAAMAAVARLNQPSDQQH